jgi:RimJ/RimL family protein N-acetyltransferase
MKPSDIHALCDKNGIPWDDDHAFMARCKLVAGKSRLDEMNEEELEEVYDDIKATADSQRMQKEGMAKLAGEVTWDSLPDDVRISTLRRLKEKERKNESFMPEPAENIFHGSPEKIDRFDLRKHYLADDEPVVFGTPERGMAISHLAKWTDADFDQGRVNDGPLTMKEKRPGAFDEIYRGKKGYLYSLDPSGFEYSPRLMRSERMSRQTPKVTSMEEIDDALEALEQSGVRLVRHPDSEKLAAWRETPSSNIDAVDYDRESKTLKVRFRSKNGPGSTYSYSNVSPQSARALMGPDSFGKHFNKHIRGKYEFEKEAGRRTQEIIEALKEVFTTPPSKEHLQAWSRHAALNLGQAESQIAQAFGRNKGQPWVQAPKEELKDAVHSAAFAVMPPTHHRADDMAGMLPYKHRDFYRFGAGRGPDPAKMASPYLELLEDIEKEAAPHAEQRRQERAPGVPKADLTRAEDEAAKMPLDPARTYHTPLQGGGYAVLAPVGKPGKVKHVVKTVLAPGMKPPGSQLPALPKTAGAAGDIIAMGRYLFDRVRDVPYARQRRQEVEKLRALGLDAMDAGSTAYGVNIPGSSDIDLAVSAESVAEASRMLEQAGIPLHKHRATRSVHRYDIGDSHVDVQVRPPHEMVALRESQARARALSMLEKARHVADRRSATGEDLKKLKYGFYEDRLGLPDQDGWEALARLHGTPINKQASAFRIPNLVDVLSPSKLFRAAGHMEPVPPAVRPPTLNSRELAKLQRNHAHLKSVAGDAERQYLKKWDSPKADQLRERAAQADAELQQHQEDLVKWRLDAHERLRGHRKISHDAFYDELEKMAIGFGSFGKMMPKATATIGKMMPKIKSPMPAIQTTIKDLSNPAQWAKPGGTAAAVIKPLTQIPNTIRGATSIPDAVGGVAANTHKAVNTARVMPKVNSTVDKKAVRYNRKYGPGSEAHKFNPGAESSLMANARREVDSVSDALQRSANRFGKKVERGTGIGVAMAPIADDLVGGMLKLQSADAFFDELDKLGAVQVGPPPARNRKEYPYVGTIQFADLPEILVENKKGSVRSGTATGGKTWRTVMPAHYGEFRRSLATDGDPVDVYVGPDPKSKQVYIVHTMKPPTFKVYDEDKVFVGFSSMAEVRKIFGKAYDDAGFWGGASACSIEDLKKMLAKRKTRGLKLDQSTIEKHAVVAAFFNELEKLGYNPLVGTMRAATRARRLPGEPSLDDISTLIKERLNAAGLGEVTIKRNAKARQHPSLSAAEYTPISKLPMPSRFSTAEFSEQQSRAPSLWDDFLNPKPANRPWAGPPAFVRAWPWKHAAAFSDELSKMAEPPPPKGWYESGKTAEDWDHYLQAGFADELDKAAASKTLSEVVQKANQDPWVKDTVSVTGGARRKTITHHGKVVGFMTPKKIDGVLRLGPIYVRPEYRGQGYASDAIRKATATTPARAVIDRGNRSSIRAFTAAGFAKVREDGDELIFEKNMKMKKTAEIDTVPALAAIGGGLLGASSPGNFDPSWIHKGINPASPFGRTMSGVLGAATMAGIATLPRMFTKDDDDKHRAQNIVLPVARK